MSKKFTREEFIRRAKEVHGDRYDYSKLEYVDTKTKVCIICPEHGVFWKFPYGHLGGSGCPKCSAYGKEEFIQKAREVHGDKYDYSKVNYVNNYTKVCIICPEHGEFWQKPNSHLTGSGCQKCKGVNKKTTEEFIKEARKVHGDKYDYSKVEYVNSKTKVCIICPKHGEFWQTPYNHIKGGCLECAKEKLVERVSSTKEEFIRKARKVHGDKYDYSKVVYTGCKNKVCIICPKHGEFWQRPVNHLNGAGCSICAGTALSTTDDFIEKARKVHGDKYDYSKVEYKGSNVKVCIICPVHGEFWQEAASHLQGNGCPICNLGYTKQYKFNLLQEFKDEYSFRAFLENSDTNILMVILRNIEPKYEPLRADIERALSNVSNENPIESLEKKYSSESDEETDDVSWAEESTDIPGDIDLDDDNAVSTMLKNSPKRQQQDVEKMMHNFEEEVNVINKIEHMLLPEDRKYIMDKFLADKRRAWMLEREECVK